MVGMRGCGRGEPVKRGPIQPNEIRDCGKMKRVAKLAAPVRNEDTPFTRQRRSSEHGVLR